MLCYILYKILLIRPPLELFSSGLKVYFLTVSGERFWLCKMKGEIF